MMTDGWYEVVAADVRLTQGDLIFQCPIVSWKRAPIEAIDADTLKGNTEGIEMDVVVITQACDLEHEKVENVLLCPHLPISEYKSHWEAAMHESNQRPTARAWSTQCKDIQDGFVWNLAILEKNQNGPMSLEHRIVDFRDVFTVPRDFLESLLKTRKQTRLRLRPPYREHLSQSFARFYMRVGLPVPVTQVW
jgi:hypothetical protein